MKKKIGILGSTGSIGQNTVKIIESNKKDFNVIFLSTIAAAKQYGKEWSAVSLDSGLYLVGSNKIS